jgi:hypothetical protein
MIDESLTGVSREFNVNFFKIFPFFRTGQLLVMNKVKNKINFKAQKNFRASEISDVLNSFDYTNVLII